MQNTINKYQESLKDTKHKCIDKSTLDIAHLCLHPGRSYSFFGNIRAFYQKDPKPLKSSLEQI